MKYPKLEDEDNLSKKLTSEQIRDIQTEFTRLKGWGTPTEVRKIIAKRYKVSYSTIYYWTNEKYRNEKRKENSTYWSKIKETDYEKWYKHKKDELVRRKNRMSRNPKLKLWHEVVSAKNEKRSKRKTIKGKGINEY